MKTVLIVEDDPKYVEAYRIKLESSGFATLVATDGAAGLDLALAKKPDIIVLDIMMPIMDGMMMMKKLRETTWGAGVPIVVLTNKETTMTDLDAIKINHPSYYLMKVNSTPDDVVTRVKEMLE